MSITDKSQTKWADFSLLPTPQIQLFREDDGENRFYYWLGVENEKIVVNTGVGITTLLSAVMPTSPYLVEWKLNNPNWRDLLKWSSSYGTLLHMAYGSFLLNRTVPREVIEAAREIAVKAGQGHDMIEKDLLAFAKFVDDYEVEPLLIEAMLISKPIGHAKQHFCQTIDLLAKIKTKETLWEVVEDGTYKSGKNKGKVKTKKVRTTKTTSKIICIDFKSNFFEKADKSFFNSHQHQLIGAKEAVEYNFPDVKVDAIANFAPNNWRTNPSYSFKVWDVTAKDKRIFDGYINIAYVKELFTPSGTKFVAPSFEEGSDMKYEMLDYVGFVKKYRLNLDDTCTV